MDRIIDKISNSVNEMNNGFSSEIEPKTLTDSYCGDGTSLGEFIHSYSQHIVMGIWMLPAILGPITGEVLILYMGLCNIPHYFIYYLLRYYLQDKRPYNCGNPDYDIDFASPCLETMIAWNFTSFMLSHSVLRKLNKIRNFSKLNIKAFGITLLIWSIFVTISVVYTKNNTWIQSILGSLVGATYGLGSATYLELFFKYHIPHLVSIPPISWMTYVDSVYNSIPINCGCSKKNCRHKINKRFYELISSGLYSSNTNSNDSDYIKKAIVKTKKIKRRTSNTTKKKRKHNKQSFHLKQMNVSDSYDCIQKDQYDNYYYVNNYDNNNENHNLKNSNNNNQNNIKNNNSKQYQEAVLYLPNQHIINIYSSSGNEHNNQY